MPSTAPAVSVIMPAFNAEKYIGEAIDSILTQTFTDFEFIIVDDGSTDRTLEIARGKPDSRIRIISNDENVGLGRTINIGIAKAQGRYLARQDADDISLPERLQKQFEYMEQHPQVAVLGTGRQTLSGDGKIKTSKLLMERPTLEDMLKSTCVVGPSIMMRKECFDAVGGYDNFFHQAEDYDLWLRVIKTYLVRNLQERLYVIRQNANSITRSKQEVLVLFRLLAKNRALGKVSDELFAKLNSTGIEFYYGDLSKEDKVFYHQRVAKRCMNYGCNTVALKHYRELRKLQGARFKVVSNMARLKLRLLFQEYLWLRK